MAKAKGRRYARDNRGRFASVGATARGGRLKTAGGNKRATVTVKATGGGKGTIVKPRGLKPGAIKPKQSQQPAGAKAVNRTRSQAAAAQRDRSRRLFEFSRTAPGRNDFKSDRGLRVSKTRINQGNLLTGKIDRVTVRSRPQRTDSLIGQSAEAKKTQIRRNRAETRYDQLLQERRAIVGRGRNKAGILAKNSQRMATVAKSFDVYDMGTGRKPRRRR
jgi:hypothetical protein